MEPGLFEFLPTLRALAGYLGEKDQFAWWPSSFFGPGSQSFLTPVFSRTAFLAQCMGATRAAALVHDERIGVGQVYHLFRLPEDLEQKLHQLYQEPSLADLVTASLANREAVLNHLRRHSTTPDKAGLGPMRVGGLQDLRDPAAWRRVAGLYLAGFERQTEVFPFFTERG